MNEHFESYKIEIVEFCQKHKINLDLMTQELGMKLAFKIIDTLIEYKNVNVPGVLYFPRGVSHDNSLSYLETLKTCGIQIIPFVDEFYDEDIQQIITIERHKIFI